MTRSEDLQQLTSKELHDRAVHYAERHFDVKFLWELLKTVPAALTAAGRQDEAEADVMKSSSLVADAFRNDDGKLSDALRPVYLDYLEQHPDA